MSRRKSAPKRSITLDSKMKNEKLAKFINHIMYDGKKSVAEKIVYSALGIIEEKVQGTSGVTIFEKALELCCISPSSSIIKKDIFKDYGLFDEDLQVCEDYDMWIRITAKEEIGYLSEPLIFKYGGHNYQLSKKFWGMDRFRIEALEKNLKNECFTELQKKIVLNTLIKKLVIVYKGAQKRGNDEIFKKYNDKFHNWSRELNIIENE